MDSTLLLTAFSTLLLLSGVGIGFIWLVRFRRSILEALQESALQQIKLAEKMGQALTHVQNQQTTYEQYVQRIAEAHLALKQDFASIITQLEKVEPNDPSGGKPPILH